MGAPPASCIASAAERANAAAGVEDYALVFAGANFEAGGVAAELQVLDLGSGRGTAHSPESEPYVDAIHSEGHFSSNSLSIGFFDLQFQRGRIGFAGLVGVIERLFGVTDLFPDGSVLGFEFGGRAQL